MSTDPETRRAAPMGTDVADGGVQAVPGPAQPRRRHPTIRKAVDYIERNSTLPISLRDLADVSNLSLFRFAAVFRREMGVSPHRFLCRVRVEHAKALLRDGVPPAIVASEAGFFDQSHLCRHFKSICGLTPGQYRSRLRGPANEQSASDWRRPLAVG